MTPSFRISLLCASTFFVGFLACATSEVTPDEPDPDPTPTVDGAAPDRAAPADATTDTAPPPKDAQPDRADALPADARVDVADAADSGFTTYPGDPFDPLAPKEGDPCPAGTPVNAIVERRCGKCGVQKAFCETGSVVGTYGPCLGEKTAAVNCLPRAREILQCGLCGSQTRQCDAACLWVENACLGEVAGGCLANEVKHLEGLCADPAEVRRQQCSGACTPGAPAPCGPQIADELVASSTVGDIVSGIFNTSSTTRTLERMNSGACGLSTSVSTTKTPFHYARVTNPSATSVNVTVTHEVPPGASKLTVYRAAYEGATAIPDPANRINCTGQVMLSTSSPAYGALTFNVPPGGSVVVYTGTSSATSAGRLKLDVKTNFLGPEPAPAVDHDVMLSPNSGETVTEPVSFVTTQTTTRLSSAGVCPRALLTTITPYRYIRVTNPTAGELVADLSLATGVNTTLVAYRGLSAPPLASERNACSGSINDSCGAAVAGADSCLTGVTLAPGESIYLLAQVTTNVAGATTFSATTQ
ncbi:MAG TPA: hypothetical protein PLR99_10335 [Polyangiaceae bacterium]|jgi:hypothetical protein|nr:hypothetical protein [Polyangiaceae bacterium]